MLFKDVVKNLNRYKPDWYRSMRVSDLSTWLVNYHADSLIPIYTSCNAEKKVTKALDILAMASRIATAAYVAMSGEQAKLVTLDPYYEVLLSLAVEERKQSPEK